MRSLEELAACLMFLLTSCLRLASGTAPADDSCSKEVSLRCFGLVIASEPDEGIRLIQTLRTLGVDVADDSPVDPIGDYGLDVTSLAQETVLRRSAAESPQAPMEYQRRPTSGPRPGSAQPWPPRAAPQWQASHLEPTRPSPKESGPAGALNYEGVRHSAEPIFVLEKEVQRIRQQDAELRREDLWLRYEDAKLREAVLSAGGRQALLRLGVSAPPEQSSASKKGIILCFLLAAALAVALGLLRHMLPHRALDELGFGESDSESENEDDNVARRREAQRLETKLRHVIRSRRDGIWQPLWCSRCALCTPTVVVFLFCVAAATALGGCVLWQLGLLQPVFSQFLVYVYVALLLSCFFAVVVAELWRLLRLFMRYIIAQFRGLKSKYKQAAMAMTGQKEDGRAKAYVPRNSSDARGASWEPAPRS